MKFLIFALIFAFSTFVYAGVDVGNGGDLVKCVPNQSNDLFGFYSLDYLVFSREPGKQPAAVQSWQESIFKIRRIFVDKLPELLPVFDEFANNILNEDQSRAQIWEPTEYALREINDEDLPASVKIPVNCRDGGRIQLVQAVIRQNPEFTGSKLIVYKYMPKIFEKLEKERPLQLSFLLVHEFLWSISDNVDRNRRINWFLHSDEIQSMSRLDVIDRLLSMGLDVRSVPRILDVNGRGHFSSLQEAIQKSRNGETILIKEGTYSMAGSVIVHSLNLIGEGNPAKTIIKGSLSDPALKLALDEGQIVRVENVMLSRDVKFTSNDSYEQATAIEFGTPGSLFLKNVIIRNTGKFLMWMAGVGNVDFENVALELDHGFLFSEYWGNLRIKNVTLISEDDWFWSTRRKKAGDVLGCNILYPMYSNSNVRIWEDWDEIDLGSFLKTNSECKAPPTRGDDD